MSDILYSYGFTMIYALIVLNIGGAVGFGIAYARYGNAKLIDELRARHKEIQHDYQQLQYQLEEYVDQNKILKSRSQTLLDQNEDFAKMISELSRYYYHLKQGAEKVKELVDIMSVYDAEVEQKIANVAHEDAPSEEELS